MCTLTFIPRGEGYLLAMNRDERTTRGVAEPPARYDLEGIQAIYPRDTEGGTWIAASNLGIAFALLNWNDVAPGGPKIRSRGEVIPALITGHSLRDAQSALGRMDLTGVLPFRLVGLFPGENVVCEWRWNQREMSSRPLAWAEQHWYSSSLGDQKASLTRGAACESASREADAGSLAWLRRLHASHDAARGPFSLCVHREGVETLSYTEVSCTPQTVQCNYFPGSPCTMKECQRSVEMERRF